MDKKFIPIVLAAVFFLLLMEFGYIPDNTNKQYVSSTNSTMTNPPKKISIKTDDKKFNHRRIINEETLIANVYLGMPEEELIKIDFNTKPTTKIFSSNYISYNYNDGIDIYLLPFKESDGRCYYGVSDIKIYSSNYQTKRGLTVGMCKDDIIKYYGEPDNQHKCENYIVLEYIFKSYGECLYFEVKDNKITSFYVTTYI